MTKKPTYEELETRVKELEREATERQRHERFGEFEKQWLSLLENIPSFITVANRDGTVRYVNKTVSSLTVEDAVGKNINDFELPEYHELSRNAIKEAFRFGKSGNYQVRRIGPDNTTSWYEIHYSPIKQDGQVVAVAFITTDIAERKRAEDNLREVSEHFRSLAEASFDGIVIMVDGVIVEANNTFASLYGYESGEVIGMKAIDAYIIDE